MKKIFLIFLVPFLLGADPLNSSLEVGTSVSHYYDSRSVFSNPAALSYQTELNQARLTSGFEYGISEGRPNEFAFSLVYGHFGFGAEKLADLMDPYLRFSFAAGLPFGRHIFLGARYSLTSSENDTLKNIHSLDLGLQIRMASFLSFGFQFNHLNRPKINGLQSPVQCIGGITLAPFKQFLLTGDIETSTEKFGDQYTYQANAQWEIFKGLFLSGGYHSEYHYQVGLRLNFGQASLFSTVQPASSEKRVIVGLQTLPQRYRSVAAIPKTLHLVIDHTLSDEGQDATLFSEGSPSLLSVLEKLKAMESDPSIPSILLEIQDFPLGLASAEEMALAVLKLREQGKKITAVLGNAETKAYLIASAASEVVIDSDAELRILGPRSEHFYAKGLLDKLGVEGEFLAKGEYKSFPEMFTRKESSEASEKATREQIHQMEGELTELLAKTRKISKSTWQEILHRVVLTPTDAKKLGLVDTIESKNNKIEEQKHSAFTISDIKSYRNQLTLPSKIAVITAEGNILQNKRRALSLIGEEQVTPEKIEGAFRKALSDPMTKAIVLRVVSPGGEILASSEIASLVERTMKRVPVYISMGDVAASGGYFISAPAKKIFADRLTYTGSIGVFLGKFSFEGLYKKLDVKKEIHGISPYAGIYSEAKSWSREERQIMGRLLDNYYDNFVKFVGTKRKIGLDLAETAAKGRVWLGQDALKLRLVDEIGGLRETIEEAAKNHVPSGDYEVWELRPASTLISALGFESPFGVGEKVLGKAAMNTLSWTSILSEEPFLYYTPMRVN